MRFIILFFVAFAMISRPAFAASFEAPAINEAQWTEQKSAPGVLTPAMVKLQVLLDRSRYSPGEIDGKAGENVDKAVAGYAAAHGAAAGSGMTADLWRVLSEAFKEPVIIEYKISETDVKGPFAEKLPTKMEDMKDLQALSYTSAKEKLSEQFHMSPELLVALNPNSKFDKPGEAIMVANVLSEKLQEKVARIEIDKTKQTMKVYGNSKTLLAMYPVTAGSKDKPAPDGVLKVTSVVKNPTYRYNPEYAFKGVKSKVPFTIKPGPNNPVGAVWIGLNKEGYGIHGTPEPSKVSKSESHGCIRMTNWDAMQLASALGKATPVEFIGDERDRAARKGQLKR